ncbi:BamA/TamA family outer membrane protein [bacterium]|nr:BamA/TamA family outer membrane protein [bacterium]
MKHLNAILAWSLLLWGSVCAADPGWDGRMVSVIDAEEMDPDERAPLAEALRLAPGRALNMGDLRTRLKDLGTSGRWMRVSVEGAIQQGRLHLFLKGARVRRLRKLEFTGVDSGVLDEVKRKVRQEQEQSVDVESFAMLRQAIKEGYLDRGYRFAQVQFLTTKVSVDEADVEIKVASGEPTRVNRVLVRGGPDDENQAMRNLIQLDRGDVFSRQLLTEGIDKIHEYLRANQYPTARVLDTPLQFSPDSMTVDLVVEVKMGDRFLIRFKGNEVFSDVQLRGLLTDEVLAQTDPSARVAALIEQKYQSVGYPDCSVRVEKTASDDGVLSIIEMAIHEGRRTLISDLRFVGADENSSVDLESLYYEGAPGVVQRRLYWQQGVSEGVLALQNRLRSMGYLNSRVTEPKAVFSDDRRSVVLFFDADIGVQTRLNRVHFSGNAGFSDAVLSEQFAFSVGKPLNRQEIVDSAKAITTYYTNHGYPEMKFSKSPEETLEISRDQQAASVAFEIEEGRNYKIGVVKIEGLHKTKSIVVMRELEINSGDLYSARLIRRSEENVSVLGLFSRVEIVEAPNPGAPGFMDLRIVVRETKPGVGEFGLGAVYEEPRLRVRPFAGLTYRNVSGLNQTASVRGDLGVPMSRKNGQLYVPFIEYSTVLGYRYPWALQLPFTFAAQLGVDRLEVQPLEQTVLTRVRFEGRLEKRFSPKFTAIYRLIRVERTVTESYLPAAGQSGAPITESIGSTGPGLILDLRDDIFNPTRGSFHTLDIELAAPPLFSQSNIAFLLSLWRNSFYMTLPWGIGLAVSANFGFAHSLQPGHPIARARLVNELSLGGQGSIRGVVPRGLAPDPTAKDMLFYNARAEANIKLFSDFGLAVFFDSGQIFPDFRSTPRSDGVGVGLRYKTPVGPVVIDFAQALGSYNTGLKFYFTVGTI